MGAAAARILGALGAEVIGVDIKPSEVPLAAELQVDLRDRAGIDAAVVELDWPLDSVFSCAGLPGPPFSELDTVLVNFVGARYLIESLVPRLGPGASIGCISSAVAVGWPEHVPTVLEFLEAGGFDEQRAWLEANEDRWAASGYVLSKVALDTWVGWRGTELIRQGIRLNCINPGPTETPMMPAFHALAGKELVDSAVGPIGRYATPEEQAWPLVLLNSERMSYVAGEVLWTDGGFQGALLTGRHRGFGA